MRESELPQRIIKAPDWWYAGRSFEGLLKVTGQIMPAGTSTPLWRRITTMQLASSDMLCLVAHPAPVELELAPVAASNSLARNETKGLLDVPRAANASVSRPSAARWLIPNSDRPRLLLGTRPPRQLAVHTAGAAICWLSFGNLL